jgi:hypothetical protein
MPFDPETVITLPGYRVGLRTPKDGSLAAGEIYVELSAPPRLWIGGPEGTVALLVATPPVTAPINTDVPYVFQEGDLLTCTMGTWTGEPTSYAYQWALDGTAAGDGSETLTVTVDDVGRTATCVVSATNDLGTTEAPPSNAHIVTDVAARTTVDLPFSPDDVKSGRVAEFENEQEEGGGYRR